MLADLDGLAAALHFVLHRVWNQAAAIPPSVVA